MTSEGFTIGQTVERLERRMAELEDRGFVDEVALQAAVSVLAEQVAALKVSVDALSLDASEGAAETVDEALDASEESGEEGAESASEAGDESGEVGVSNSDTPAEGVAGTVEEVKEEIEEEIAESIDVVEPRRTHPLTRAIRLRR